MAALITDEKGLVLIDKKTFLSNENTPGYHPGPVTQSAADGTPISSFNKESPLQRCQRND